MCWRCIGGLCCVCRCVGVCIGVLVSLSIDDV